MKQAFLIIFYLVTLSLFGETKLTTVYHLDSAAIINCSTQFWINDEKPNPILQSFRKNQKNNKRITSAVLAFPFPFGIVGLHRIYLGTKPHVPVAYITSFGGACGILPLIDFFAITFGKNFDTYRDNGKVFMWIKE